MEAEEASGGKKSSDSKAKSSEELVSPTEHEIPNNEVTEPNGDRSESSASHKRRSRKDDKSQERHSDEPKHRSKSRDRDRNESRRHRPKSAHRRKSDKDDEEIEGEEGHRRHSRSSSKHKERSSKDEDKERHRSKSSSRHKSESSKDGDREGEEERHRRSRSSSRHRRKSTKDLEEKLDEVTEENREDRPKSSHRRRSDKESSKDRESSRSRHDEDRGNRKSRTSEGRDDDGEHVEDDRRRSRSRSSRRKHSDKDDAANDLAKSEESVKLRSSILKSSSKDRSHRPKSSYQRPPLTSTVASLVSANIQPEQSEKSPTTNIKEPNLSKSSIDFEEEATLNGSLELTDIEQLLHHRNLKFDFRLDDVFNEKADSKENADPGDYETAFSLSSDALKLGPNIHFIRFLMRHFENSVRTRRIEQATEAKNQLASLLRNNVQTNANEIKKRALNLAGSNQHIPAFLFFQIASFFFERELPPRKSVNEIRLCVWEIKEICRRMTEEEEEESESGEQFSSLVSQLVLGMLELKDRFSALKKVPPKLHAVSQAHCCYYIALCLGWDEKYGQSERYWTEAIAISDGVFADKAAEHKYYGDLKSNLAYVYECQSRYGEAVLMYNQSLSCVLQATDFSSVEEKTACVGTLKEYIKDAKSMGNIN